MTTLDLDALQAAAEAATPGLWFSYCPDGAALNPERATFVTGPKYRIMDKSMGFSPEDGAYIAAARPEVIGALIDRLRKAEAASKWQPIETAPKGGGAELVTDPEWVDPPCILLLFEGGKTIVGYWDWYFAEGGIGYDGGLAWVEPCSGERLHEHYDAPIAWMTLPAAPTSANSEGAKG